MTRRWLLSIAMIAAGCAHTPDASVPGWATFSAYLPFDSASQARFDPGRLRGRVVLVTFVATWCFPCLTDLVTLKRLEELYGKKGFSNVIVGMDLEGRRVLEPFALGYELTCPVIVGDDRLRSGETPFGRVRELPTRLLFGRDGQVVVGYTGVADYSALEKIVVEALGK